MGLLLQDLRYAVRTWRRQPGFAALAVATLALGIGANAAMFSVVNAVLLKPLDYPRPDRIVALTNLWRRTGLHGTVSAPDFHDWHDGASSFGAMAYYIGGDTSVSVAGAADYAPAVRVTPGFFDVFGVAPAIGRPWTRDEQTASGPPAALISHDFWGGAAVAPARQPQA